MVTRGLQGAALLRLASGNADGGSYSGVFLVLVLVLDLSDLVRLRTGKTTESQRTPTVGEFGSDRRKKRQEHKQGHAESTEARARWHDPESQRTPTAGESDVDREKHRQAHKQEQTESTEARARWRDPESQRTRTVGEPGYSGYSCYSCYSG